MTTKVLVFESDAEFAQTLREGLGAYDCELTVVDDGEEGIAAAETNTPDLILLSIELPRMNGFSVCNKLKRNKDLKSVPLVLLSSEATEETFEQHKRLRTRADVYLHKPVTVEDIVGQLGEIVPLQKRDLSEEEFEDIVLDDEMEIEEVPDSGDAFDAETDEAFGNLLAPAPAPDAEEASQAPDSSTDAPLSLPPAPPESVQAESIRPESVQSVDLAILQAQHQQQSAVLLAEVAEQKKLISELEEELRGARAATAAEEDAKAQALGKKDAELAIFEREIEDLKSKLESNEASGTAREFLDLREQLNKKDKEILDVRDGLTSKEKELIRSKDENIALGREKADLLDRVAGLESEQTQLSKERNALAQDKEQANKRADDFKSKSERLAADLDTRSSELKEAREHHENVMATRDAQEASLREDHRQALQDAAQKAQEEQKKAVDQAVSEAQDRAAEAQEAALVLFAEEAKTSQEAAIVDREGELKVEHDSKLAALHRANEESLRKLRAEHEHASEEMTQAAAERLSVREGELAREKRAELEVQQNEFDAQLAAAEAQKAALQEELRGRNEELESVRASLQERGEQLVSVEASLASKRAETVELSDQLQAETVRLSQARDKWQTDSAALSAAKEALAGVLQQIEAALGREMP